MCQQGSFSPLLDDPEPKGLFPLKFLIFLAGAYTNCKMQLDMPGQKMQKEACTGMRHRLPFGTGTQKKQMCFFYIPATPCGGGREKESGTGGTAMKKSWKKRFLLVLAPLVAVVGIPIIINESYKANSGYMTMWSAADALSYHICSPPQNHATKNYH